MPARRKRAASTAATPEPATESTTPGGTVVRRKRGVQGRTPGKRSVSVFGKRPTKDPMALLRYTVKKEIQRAEKQLSKLHTILDNLD
jgi:hypothetical protein